MAAAPDWPPSVMGKVTLWCPLLAGLSPAELAAGLMVCTEQSRAITHSASHFLGSQAGSLFLEPQPHRETRTLILCLELEASDVPPSPYPHAHLPQSRSHSVAKLAAIPGLTAQFLSHGMPKGLLII